MKTVRKSGENGKRNHLFGFLERGAAKKEKENGTKKQG